MHRNVLVATARTSDPLLTALNPRFSKKLPAFLRQHALIQFWTCTSACRPLVQAVGMQAEHQEKEASSEDGTPASKAAGPRSNTAEIVAHIYLLAVAFP